mgnify:CR=1 FL=1
MKRGIIGMLLTAVLLCSVPSGEVGMAEAASNSQITYQTHVQSYGWQDWKSDGELAGTTGQGKRIEALRVKLTGEVADY